MEDINDEILVVVKERAAAQEKLDNLLKTKAESLTENSELNKLIQKSEHKIKVLSDQLDQLYDMAMDLARAAACEFFPEDCD